MDYKILLPITYCNHVEVLRLTALLCKDAIINNISGDFAEAGVANGAHGIVMNDCSWGQRVYLFDSFKGISVHGPIDTEWTAEYGPSIADPRKSGGITVCTLPNVKTIMSRYVRNLDNFIFVEGWFIDTFPLLTDEKFSVLRLDCDLYDPYMLCFKYLYPRLSKGGWLIIDDWQLSGCRQAIIDSGLSLDDFQTINQIAYLKK